MAATTSKGGGDTVVTNVATLTVPKAPNWGPYLAQWMMPIEPVAEGSLPTFKTGADTAIQVHAVTKTADGLVDTVRCIAPLAAGQTTANVDTTTAGTSTGISNIPNASWLDNLYVQIDPENTSHDYRCVIRDGVETPWRVGDYLDRRRYFGRFQDQFSSRSIESCRTYLTRRADIEIYELDIIVNTGVCDPATYNSDGEGIYFGGIKLAGIPSGWSIITSVERPTMDLSEGWLMKPLGGTERNHMPPSISIAFRIALCRTSDRAIALDILRRELWGTTTGNYSYYERPAYGEAQYRLMEPRNTLSYGGQTGKAAMDYWAGEYLGQMESILSEYDTSSGVFFHGVAPNSNTGWIYPPAQPHGGHGGGPHKSFYSNFSNHPDEWAANDLLVEQQYHRMGIWMTHPDTGETLHGSHFAAANSGVLPWSCWFGNSNKDRMIPPMAPVSTNGVVNATLPNNRPWNQLESGNSCPYTTWSKWYEHGGSVSPGFNPFPSSHCSRMMGGTRAAMWSCDDDIARDLLEAYVAHYSFAVSPQPVDFTRSNLGRPPGYLGRGGQYADLQELLVWNTNNPQNGGFFGRDVGEMTILDAAYYRHADTDRRAILKSKFELLYDNWTLEHYANGSNYRQSDGSHIYGPIPEPWDNNWSSYYYTTLLFHQEEACHATMVAGMAAFDRGTDPTRLSTAIGWIDTMFRNVHDGYDPNAATSDPTRNVITAYRVNPWGQNYGYGGAQNGWSPGHPNYQEIPYYRVGVVVSWNNNNYRCILQHTPDPSRDPSNATYWVLDNSIQDGDPLPAIILYETWANSSHQDFNRFEGSKLAVLLYRYTGDSYYLDRAKQNVWGQTAGSWRVSGGDLTYDEAVDEFWGGVGNRMSNDGGGFSAFVNTLHNPHYYGMATEFNAFAASGGGAAVSAQAQRAGASVSTTSYADVTVTAQAQTAGTVIEVETGQNPLNGRITATASQAGAAVASKVTRTGTLAVAAQRAGATAVAVADTAMVGVDNFIIAVEDGYPGGKARITVS